MAVLKERQIPSDNGKDTLETLPGSMFDSPTSNSDDLSLLVNAKGGVVTLVEPYHEIDGNVITLYAEDLADAVDAGAAFGVGNVFLLQPTSRYSIKSIPSKRRRQDACGLASERRRKMVSQIKLQRWNTAT